MFPPEELGKMWKCWRSVFPCSSCIWELVDNVQEQSSGCDDIATSLPENQLNFVCRCVFNIFGAIWSFITPARSAVLKMWTQCQYYWMCCFCVTVRDKTWGKEIFGSWFQKVFSQAWWRGHGWSARFRGAEPLVLAIYRKLEWKRGEKEGQIKLESPAQSLSKHLSSGCQALPLELLQSRLYPWKVLKAPSLGASRIGFLSVFTS